MEIEQGILLSSYEIPKGEDKNTFSYDSMKNVDYSKLEKSEKFTPALYHEKDGIWKGVAQLLAQLFKAHGCRLAHGHEQ
jgi:hypothetical protein